MPGRPFTVPRPFTVRAALREMSDVAMELLSVTLTRAPLGLKLDAYGFLAAVLDTAEDATRRALRPCARSAASCIRDEASNSAGRTGRVVPWWTPEVSDRWDRSAGRRGAGDEFIGVGK